jgi:hypothetical protein
MAEWKSRTARRKSGLRSLPHGVKARAASRHVKWEWKADALSKNHERRTDARIERLQQSWLPDRHTLQESTSKSFGAGLKLRRDMAIDSREITIQNEKDGDRARRLAGKIRFWTATDSGCTKQKIDKAKSKTSKWIWAACSTHQAAKLNTETEALWCGLETEQKKEKSHRDLAHGPKPVKKILMRRTAAKPNQAPRKPDQPKTNQAMTKRFRKFSS